MCQLLFLFEPSTSKLCYPRKPQPRTSIHMQKSSNTSGKCYKTFLLHQYTFPYLLVSFLRWRQRLFCAMALRMHSHHFGGARAWLTKPNLIFGACWQPWSKSGLWIPFSLCRLLALDIWLPAFCGPHLVGVCCMTSPPRGVKFMTTFGQSPLRDKVLQRGANIWTTFGRSLLCDKVLQWGTNVWTTFGQNPLCDKVLQQGANVWTIYGQYPLCDAVLWWGANFFGPKFGQYPLCDILFCYIWLLSAVTFFDHIWSPRRFIDN